MPLHFLPPPLRLPQVSVQCPLFLFFPLVTPTLIEEATQLQNNQKKEEKRRQLNLELIAIYLNCHCGDSSRSLLLFNKSKVECELRATPFFI
jgi:hypothetical protein